jgi:type II secretory pathway component GspD/PulD (secretin)
MIISINLDIGKSPRTGFANLCSALFAWLPLVLLLNSCGTIEQQPILPSGDFAMHQNMAQVTSKSYPDNIPDQIAKKVSSQRPQIATSHIQCSNSDNGDYPGKLPHISLSFFDASVRDIFAEIGLLIDFPVVIDEFVEGLLSIEVENIRLDKAFDLISASSNLGYRFFDDYILVGVNSVDTPSWASLSVNCRYWPRYVSAELLFNSLGEIEKQFVFYPKGADYLTINAPPGIQKKIQNSLKVFDHSPGQVLLELSIVEITKTDINRLGIRWHNTEAPLAQGIISGQFDLMKQLQLLAQSGQTQIKAMPSLVSTHGKKAKFSTKQQTNQWQTADKDEEQIMQNRYKNSQKDKEREILEYGVNMEIIPYIIDGRTITLEIIDASVSDIVVEGDGYLSLIKHKISNQVTVNNREFVLLGGMMQQSDIKHTEGFPGLKKLPLLGRLFRQEKQRTSDYEVWIMIRPSILD